MKTKRMISFLSAVCLALTGTAANLTAAAATAPPKDGSGTYEGMKYKIMGGRCYITGYTSKLPEEVVIPSEIKNAKVIWIDMNAFENCSTLKSVTIPDTVTTINLYSFKNCTALETINVPEGIQFEEVFSSAFENTAWVNAKIDKNEMAILGNYLVSGAGCKGDIVIPEGVTALSDGAFEDNQDITSITFASTMTEVGDWAFMSCNSLKSVTIPGNIEEINQSAFSSCKNLERVVLEEGVEEIDKSAFRKCTALKDISFPRSLWTIESDAFQYCTALESVTLPETFRTAFSGAFTYCTSLKEITAMGYYSSMSGKKAPEDQNLDYGITVSNEGEYSKKFTYDGVIRGYSGSLFEEYAKLFDLKFESLGEAPKSGVCGENLTWKLEDDTLTISGSGSMDNYNPRMKWNGEYTWESYQGVAPWFMYRDSIKKAVLGPYVIDLASGALYDMPALESVTFLCPNTALSSSGSLVSSFVGGSIINNGRNEDDKIYYDGVICGYEGSSAERFANSYSFRFEALEGQPELEGEDVPLTGSCGENAVWTLDSRTGVLTISGTGEMQNYELNSEKDLPPWTIAAVAGYISDIVIEDGITAIGDNAFLLCPDKEITVPASVSRIGEDAFYQCGDLEKITILNPACEIEGDGWTITTGIRNNEPLFEGKICGYADSTAQKYAEQYNYKFALLEGAPAVTTAATTKAAIPATTTVPVTTALSAAVIPATTTAPVTTVIGNHECLTTAATAKTTIPATTTTTAQATTVIGDHECLTTAATTKATLPATTTTTAQATTVIGDHECLTTAATTKATTKASTKATTSENTTASVTTTMPEQATTTPAPVTSAPGSLVFRKCGENATWAFSIEAEKLFIQGEGDMEDYDLSKQESAPWSEYAYHEIDVVQRIRTIEIGKSITKIGAGAFNGCASVKEAVVPENVKHIGKNAFTGCAALEKLTIMNPECEIADGAVSSGEKDGKAYFSGTIVGFKDSTAQKYAEKNGFKFEALDIDPQALVYPDNFTFSLKLVPYLKADGYTEAEQAEYQKKADDLMKKTKKITVTGDIRVPNEEIPGEYNYIYQEDMILTEDPAEIAALADYDSKPLTVYAGRTPESSSIITPDTFKSGHSWVTFSFADENGKELLRLFSLDGFGNAWSTKDQITTYYDKAMIVCDLSKYNAEDEEPQMKAITDLPSKTVTEAYGTADYDCVTALGDTNGDNAVSVDDAQLALKAYTEAVAGLKQNLTQAQRMASDVNRDGSVTVEDAQLILKYYTEKTVAGKEITWKDIRG